MTEFNFPNDQSLNDAEIHIKGRYPLSGYAVNDISTALISVESGSGTITLQGPAAKQLKIGDRILIKPGEAYAFETPSELVIRYIAAPAWTPEQARVVDAQPFVFSDSNIAFYLFLCYNHTI